MKNSIMEPGEIEGNVEGNSIGKKPSYQRPRLPDTFSSMPAPRPVEISFPTASGRDGAQTLAEIVNRRLARGILFCAPGNAVSKRLGGNRKISGINPSLTPG
jgi:hypothetical protein